MKSAANPFPTMRHVPLRLVHPPFAFAPSPDLDIPLSRFCAVADPLGPTEVSLETGDAFVLPDASELLFELADGSVFAFQSEGDETRMSLDALRVVARTLRARAQQGYMHAACQWLDVPPMHGSAQFPQQSTSGFAALNFFYPHLAHRDDASHDALSRLCTFETPAAYSYLRSGDPQTRKFRAEALEAFPLLIAGITSVEEDAWPGVREAIDSRVNLVQALCETFSVRRSTLDLLRPMDRGGLSPWAPEIDLSSLLVAFDAVPIAARPAKRSRATA